MYREHFLYITTIFDLILSFELKKMRRGPRIWVMNQLIWEPEILFIRRSGDKEPTSPRKRDVMSTLTDERTN